jgi:hypothetical protein
MFVEEANREAQGPEDEDFEERSVVTDDLSSLGFNVTDIT